MMNRAKEIIRLIIVNCFVFVMFFEAACFLFFLAKNQSVRPAYKYIQSGSFSFIQFPNCSYESTLRLHPFFAFNSGNFEKCENRDDSGYGFISRKFPQSYDSGYYTILLVGASVANQIGTFAVSEEELMSQTPYLETYLNRNWTSPNGRPFKVLNASIPASSMPSEFIVASFFLDRVDHVLSIGGYNEHWMLNGNESIEEPREIWRQLVVASEEPIKFSLVRTLSQWRVGAMNSIVRYSYSVAGFFQLVTSIFSTALPIKRVPRVFPNYSINEDKDRTKAEIIKSYLRYLGYTRELCSVEMKKFNGFLQPSLFIAKIPTKKEQEILRKQHPASGTNLDILSRAVESDPNRTIESMTRLYEKVEETVYENDPVHPNNFGLKLMSEYIGTRVAASNAWKPSKGDQNEK